MINFSVAGLQGQFLSVFFLVQLQTQKKQIFSKEYINIYTTFFCYGIVTDAQ